MPNKKCLKLFVKTWPPKGNQGEEGDEDERPLTATLDKPAVLNISFIDKIDMTLMGEELLSIRNLCRIPVTVAFTNTTKKETSRKTMRKLPQTKSADEERHPKRKPLSELHKSSSTSDANNNKTQRPKRLPVPKTAPKLVTQSTKLPEPCKTCGRSDQPERLHSHPKTSHRPVNQKMDVKVRVPVKNSVQKPVAIRYKSKENQNCAPERKLGQLRKSPTAPNVSAKRTLTCYLCGREFGTASLPLHEPKCLQKWQRENAGLPAHLKRKVPPKPADNLSKEEWNQFAWNASQMNLVPCDNCNRTFLPDRLIVHQRSCKPSHRITKSSSVGTIEKLNEGLPQGPPIGVVCDICGKRFGTKSIKIHRAQCLKKHQDAGGKLVRERSNSSQQQDAAAPPAKEAEERPPSGPQKPPMFRCYLCGELFSVHSIYIHEPQCLKKWRVENDKLPPNKRQKEPLKPDIKFTPTGEVDFRGTFNRIWENHLAELVACRFCGRKFRPDRIATHEGVCDNNKLKTHR